MKRRALICGVLGAVVVLAQYLGFTQAVEQFITTIAAILIAVLAFWIFSELREKEREAVEKPVESLDTYPHNDIG